MARLARFPPVRKDLNDRHGRSSVHWCSNVPGGFSPSRGRSRYRFCHGVRARRPLPVHGGTGDGGRSRSPVFIVALPTWLLSGDAASQPDVGAAVSRWGDHQDTLESVPPHRSTDNRSPDALLAANRSRTGSTPQVTLTRACLGGAGPSQAGSAVRSRFPLLRTGNDGPAHLLPRDSSVHDEHPGVTVSGSWEHADHG